MPVTTTSRADLRPVFQAKPDMRFGTTFISNKYRDYAVKGEVLMDKATGEIFTKRPEDGRVVSFFQNKKYMHELMLELRVLLNNNSNFRYPGEDDVEALYLSTDYDLMTIYDDKEHNIMTEDTIIPNSSVTSFHKLSFNISNKSNGFFCRMTSRDSDKAVIEWVTSQYNTLFKNYTGTDPVFLAEHDKFNGIEKWEDSNASINYTLELSYDNGTTQSYDFTDYVRINEQASVLFPNSIGENTIGSANKVTVTINSITYDKIHFMIKYKASLDPSFNDGLMKFMYPDGNIYIRYCNICSFVDESTDIDLHGNEFIVAMMEVSYVRRYMLKMSRLMVEPNFIFSSSRPSNDIWGANGIWAEHVRDAFGGGYEINMECETNLKKLADYLAANDNTQYVNISSDINDTDNMYGDEGTVI